MAEGVDERPSCRDRVWWRNPKLLGAGALGLIVILNIIFI
jgi:hypothetical protein